MVPLAARKGGLGRGLDALIGSPRPASPAPAASPERGDAAQRQPLEVEIGRIRPNPHQPRKRFDETQLAELSDSIREHGVIQPLVVTEEQPSTGEAGAPGVRGSGGRYTLVAGERRWQAAKIAGLTRVPVVIREAAGRDLLELALIENVQRADLNPLEEALAFQQLSEEFGLTQDEIGQRVHKSRFAISNTIRLLQLPASVQQLVLDGKLTEGHARAILGLGDLPGGRDVQRRVANEAVANGWTVRQIEELVRRHQSAAKRPPANRRRDQSVDEIETQFQDALQTKVTLTRSRRGGRLTIHYYDDEQLMSLYDRLAGSA
jgi:ParB family chromosome partitioning protein